MASEYDQYLFNGDVELSNETFNRRWRLFDNRFAALEAVQLTYTQDADALRAIALQRITDALDPVINLANMGDLLRCAAVTTLAIATGEKTFWVTESTRAAFAGPLYIIAAVSGEVDKWMAGQVTAWDAETGELVVNITNVRGSGSFSSWDISVASIPPEVPASQQAEDISLAAISGMTASDVQAGVEELQTAKAPIASPTFTGTPAAPTASLGTDTTQLANTAFVQAALNALIDAAPGALNTLNELAAALGDDPNYAATITAALATKSDSSHTHSGMASLTTEDQVLSGGARVTAKSLGTISSGTVTPDPGDRPLQYYTNGGAHTLAPPANDGSCYVDVLNNASAGAITTSGFDMVAGDSFDTTNANLFRCAISRINGVSLLQIQAMQ